MSGLDTPNKRRAALSARTFPTGVGDDPGHIEPDDARHLSLRAYPMTPRDEAVPGQEALGRACAVCLAIGDQLHRGCYELASNDGGFGFNADCGYCYPPGVHETFPCSLRAPAFAQPALCNAFGLPSTQSKFGECITAAPPGYAMRYDADDVDAEPLITTTPFRSNTQYRYLLRAVTIHVAPCMYHGAAVAYCSSIAGCCSAYWLCKVFSWGSDRGWKMLCNTPVRATTQNEGRPDQYVNVERPFKVYPDTGIYRAPLFVELAPTTNDGCFQFVDPYCWLESCDAPVAFPEWDCIGHQQHGSPYTDPREGWKTRVYLDRLYIYFSDDWGFTEDNATFPHKNAQTIPTRNLQLAALAGAVTQIDGPDNAAGHNSRASYGSSQASRWKGVKTWTLNNPIDAPLVALEASARLRMRGTTLRAALHLTAAKTWLVLNVERLDTCRSTSKWEYMLHASITVTGYYQWLRSATVDSTMALLGLSFLNDDLGDWRIADPDDPEIEHPSEFWYFRGAAGERINKTVTWRGLRSQWPYAAPNVADFACDGTTGSGGDPLLNGTKTCCEAYQLLENENVYGEWNDCNTTPGADGAPDPNVENIQRFRGHVYFACPGLNTCGPLPRYTHAETGAHCECNEAGVSGNCD